MSSLDYLPEIEFVEKDASKTEASIIITYEAISGRKLFPGDPVLLFLKSLASIIIQQRVVIDYSAKQNLLKYAEKEYLDHKGAGVRTPRLDASSAVTTFKITLSAAQPGVLTVPAGIRATPGKNILFATTANVDIPAGDTIIEVSAECTESGELGNGFAPGQINQIVDPFPWLKSIENTTLSEGGANIENDDSYRERIHEAPEKFSTAGPDGAYIYWAKTVSSKIIDVRVSSPSPVIVHIHVLWEDGAAPTQDILDAVLAVCSDKKIRPLTDQVSVFAREAVNYEIDAIYYIHKSNETISSSIQLAVQKAVDEYELWQKSKLGRGIDPSELNFMIKKAGAYRVVITAPTYTALLDKQVGIATVKNVLFGGLVND